MGALSLALGLGLANTPSKGGGVPAGYTVSTINGVPVTYLGARVFDNSPTVPLSVRTA